MMLIGEFWTKRRVLDTNQETLSTHRASAQRPSVATVAGGNIEQLQVADNKPTARATFVKCWPFVDSVSTEAAFSEFFVVNSIFVY